VLERTSQFFGILVWTTLVAAIPAAGSGPDSAPRVAPHLAPFLLQDANEVSSSASLVRPLLRGKNPVSLEDYTLVPSDLPALGSPAVDQVIVAGDALAGAFQELAQWETRRGIPTVVRSVSWIESHYEGFDRPARIRSFLRAAHDLWGTQYVILGGDVEHVPARYVSWGEESLLTDLYYECLDREWNEDGDEKFAEPAAQIGYDDVVNDLASHPDGSLWIATYSGFVRRAANGGFTIHDFDNGFPSNSVYSVSLGQDGSLWVGTDAGAVTYSAGQWTTTTTDHGLPTNQVFCILAVTSNDVWAGTDQGIAHWNGTEWRSWGAADGLPAELITSMALEGGSLWAGTLQGAVRIQNDVVTVFNTSNSGLRSNWVLSVGVDSNGAVWFGHVEDHLGRGGYSRLDHGSWTSDDLLSSGGLSIRDFLFGPASNEWWAATGEGLFHHTASGNELFDETEGLAGTTSTSVLRLATGQLAVGGNEGLSIGEPGDWSVFDSDNGLPAAESISDLIDLIPDVIGGRIPAASPSDVATYVEKLREYELGANSSGANRALFLGEVLFGAQDGKDICRNTAEVFPAAMQRVELFESEGTQDAEAAREQLNEGPGIVVNVSHGSYDVIGMGSGLELLFNGDMDAIDSSGRSGFYVVYSCNVGGFDQDCSMEHLLFNPNGGAVATLSNTREAIASIDAEFNRAVFQQFFQSGHSRPAEALSQTRSTFVEANESRFQSSGWWRRMYFARSFLGAPTVPIWRGTPKPLSVQHPALCPIQRAPFEVIVRGPGALPVEGALVCISKGDDDYARGWTDSNGRVVFQFRPESLGTVEIVATAPDHLPYQGTSQVSPATQPTLVAHGWAVAGDANASEPLGPRARTLDITLGLRNVGLDAGAPWQLQLSSMNPLVSVSPATGTLAPIPAGQIGWTNSFALQMSPEVLDGTIVTVMLTGSGPSSFSETFMLAMETPVLAFGGVIVSGSEITPRVANRGSTPVDNVTATLLALEGGGTVLDGEITIPSIQARSSILPSAGFQVSGPVDAKYLIVIGALDCAPVVQRIDRQNPEGASSLRTSPTPDGAQLTWSPSPSADVAGYRVLTRGESAGLWVDEYGHLITEGTVAQLVFTPGTSRECRVVAVDSSGIASPDSVAATAVAAPLTLPGWPQRISSILGPSPLIASDLDGDGTSEVIVGSMWEANAVHAFRVNGQEWTNGDLDASTNGIFGVTMGRINGAPLVVDVNGDGSKEIFAGSYDGFVHAWKTNGPAGEPQPLTGWPVAHGTNGVRTSPVAGDLDGDGDLEIVTVANDGYIRAFHANGTMLSGWPRETPGRSLGSTPAIADLNHDGRDDVVVGGTDSTLYVYSGTGANLPGWPHHVGAKILSCPVLVDIDGDEDLEIFVFDRNGAFWGFHHENSDAIPGPDLVPGWPVMMGVLEIAPPSPAVADFDRDGVPEIVVNGLSSILILKANGTHYSGSPIVLGSSGANSPVIADLDSDGELDILAGLWDRRLVAVRPDGSMLPAWPWVFLETPTSTPAIADMDGDGKLDVVIGADDASIRILRLPTPALPGVAPWPSFHGGSDLRGVYVPGPNPPVGGPEVSVSPSRLALAPARPNPFRNSTEIRFEISTPAIASLEIFDVSGRQVARLLSSEKLEPGFYTRTWDGRDSAGRASSAGVYFVRLRAGSEIQGSRILLLR